MDAPSRFLLRSILHDVWTNLLTPRNCAAGVVDIIHTCESNENEGGRRTVSNEKLTARHQFHVDIIVSGKEVTNYANKLRVTY